jgi:hypothetical protein
MGRKDGYVHKIKYLRTEGKQILKKTREFGHFNL